MKTVTVSPNSTEIQSLLEQARHEDILVRAADGSEFMVSAVDDFEYEVVRTRQNSKLTAMLKERAKQETTVSMQELKRQLGIDG